VKYAVIVLPPPPHNFRGQTILNNYGNTLEKKKKEKALTKFEKFSKNHDLSFL
jgi:hypothetical protein